MLKENIIKSIRIELSISQEQMARDLNISFSTINRWENDRTSPSKLAKIRLYEYCILKNVSQEVIEGLSKL